jgi:hypothetical protein
MGQEVVSVLRVETHQVGSVPACAGSAAFLDCWFGIVLLRSSEEDWCLARKPSKWQGSTFLA